MAMSQICVGGRLCHRGPGARGGAVRHAGESGIQCDLSMIELWHC
jgi:hypothetical protein